MPGVPAALLLVPAPPVGPGPALLPLQAAAKKPSNRAEDRKGNVNGRLLMGPPACRSVRQLPKLPANATKLEDSRGRRWVMLKAMSESQPEPRIGVIIRSSAWLGMVAHAGFIPLFWLTGYPVLAVFNMVSVPTWVVAWLLNRRKRSTLAMWLLTAEVVLHAVLAVMLLGWNSGFQYYLIPLIPFMMFNDRAHLVTVSVASGCVLLAFALLRAAASPFVELTPALEWFKYANMVIPFLMLGLQSYYFRLASANVERQMTEMALTDPLTGLFNRRQMNQRLQEEAARFKKQGTDFSVIIADIDHFKDINDRYGHDMGDRVLARVALLFAEALRGSDAVARWGGEEFLVLLPGAHLNAAEEVAQRLRVAAETRLGDIEGMSARLTVTFGVATFAAGTSLEACLKAADDALYRGKASGRNRVVSDISQLA
jgi:diguanylate cyclase (GGDEF)-like protein